LTLLQTAPRKRKKHLVTNPRTILATASLASLLIAFATAPCARADIFQWQYINPANPSLGKQQSTTLCVGGAGSNAVPGAYLGSRNLTKAYLISANLTQAHFGGGGGIYDTSPAATLIGADFSHANLTNADFSGYLGFDPNDPGVYYYLGADLTDASLMQATLTGANFVAATLTGANLTDTDIRGVNFPRVSVEYFPYDGARFGGIGLAQLYSTASYKAHDLTGIGLSGNSLDSANLTNQNLASANFFGATITGANLTGAEIRNANFTREYRYPNYFGGLTLPQLYSTASYLAHDLSGISLAGNDLKGANLADQNLADATFQGATLTNADLSRTCLTNASFSAFSYSYHAANLSGAHLTRADLANADFSGSDSLDGADLTGADLSHARLTNARFNGRVIPIYDDEGAVVGEETIPGAKLTNANLTAADARGANFQYAALAGANTSNLIQSNGRIAVLNLTAGASLIVRDYDGNTAAAPATGALPIVVEGNSAIDTTGTLQLVFDADPWDSTISFAPGIAVTRGGTLELTFAPDVNLASQLGRTIDLFDWAGVNPTGMFNVSSPYTWNLSDLYTTGEVTLIAVMGMPGDFNNNGEVDAADYVVWRDNFGMQSGANSTRGDGDNDGDVDGADYLVWQRNFGRTADGRSVSNATVPEPATALLLVLGAAIGCWRTMPTCIARSKTRWA
jgi:uncharacterized protein YjbI with pentapeptide repeats